MCKFKFMFVFFNDRMRTLVPPEIAYLSASLKNSGFETVVFDTSFYAEHDRLKEEKKKEDAGLFKAVNYSDIGVELKHTSLVNDMLEAIDKEKPGAIGFSVYSQAKSDNFRLAKAIKERFPAIPIIMGGFHVNIEPETVLSKDFVDYICLGEGEGAIVDFCDALSKGKPAIGIQNIGYKDNGKPVLMPLRSLIAMDDLPYYDYESFKEYHQYGPYRGRFYKMVLAEGTRTCPYGCTYCGNRIYKPHYKESGESFRYRNKSPERFVSEMKYYKEKFGAEIISIIDGTFVAMRESVLEEMAPLYKSEVGLPFWCDATVHCITPRKAELLKDMGCICINMGIETGNEDYRKKYLDRGMSNQKIVDAFLIVRNAGIETRSYNIIGLPYQTRQDIEQTIELNRKCKVGSVSMSIFMPYDGTPLRKLCVEEGLVDVGVEIIGDGTEPIIKNPNLSDEELLGLYNTFAIYVQAPYHEFERIKEAEKLTPEANRIRLELLEKYC